MTWVGPLEWPPFVGSNIPLSRFFYTRLVSHLWKAIQNSKKKNGDQEKEGKTWAQGGWSGGSGRTSRVKRGKVGTRH